ncbi:MAG TPA: hypothetical protein VI794_00985 [Patescibacteria group bacterium]|nr:hypothetical protein [Patescibacteria group bacterium]
MGNRKTPTAADFLTIEELSPELVRKLGYLPQCTYGDLTINGHLVNENCGREASWSINGDHYCVTHKMVIVDLWEVMIADWIKRPKPAQDPDLELLELIRDELKPPVIEVYPSVNVGKVVKDLSLPETPAGRSLAAWYLWEMGIFDIHERAGFFNEQS